MQCSGSTWYLQRSAAEPSTASAWKHDGNDGLAEKLQTQPTQTEPAVVQLYRQPTATRCIQVVRYMLHAVTACSTWHAFMPILSVGLILGQSPGR